MVTMERVDQMMQEAQQTQDDEVQKLETVAEGAVGMEITGVQLNKASRMTTIYHRLNGDPRRLPYLAAVFALKKRYNIPGDPRHKQFVFSASPTVPYHEGTIKCLLHPDNPNRELYDSWGLPVCMTATIASPGALVRYMDKRHHGEYEIIKDHEREQKRLEEVATSRAMTESMMEAIKHLSQVATPTQALNVSADETVTATEEEPIGSVGEPSIGAPPYISDKPPKKRKARSDKGRNRGRN